MLKINKEQEKKVRKCTKLLEIEKEEIEEFRVPATHESTLFTSF